MAFFLIFPLLEPLCGIYIVYFSRRFFFSQIWWSYEILNLDGQHGAKSVREPHQTFQHRGGMCWITFISFTPVRRWSELCSFISYRYDQEVMRTTGYISYDILCRVIVMMGGWVIMSTRQWSPCLWLLWVIQHITFLLFINFIILSNVGSNVCEVGHYSSVASMLLHTSTGHDWGYQVSIHTNNNNGNNNNNNNNDNNNNNNGNDNNNAILNNNGNDNINNNKNIINNEFRNKLGLSWAKLSSS